jgi:hypothetical protein
LTDKKKARNIDKQVSRDKKNPPEYIVINLADNTCGLFCDLFSDIDKERSKGQRHHSDRDIDEDREIGRDRERLTETKK